MNKPIIHPVCRGTYIMLAGLFVLASPLARAQAENDSLDGGQETSDDSELARKTQNPISDLISVPFQNNFNFGVGPENATQYVLNIQPVVPFQVSERWNIVTRTIVPIINQPSPAPGVSSAFGLGDINPTAWLSPREPGRLIWGAGATLTLPTGTDPALTSGQWAAGPSVVMLTTTGPWVTGVLANQQWGFSGWRDRDFNRTLIQPFINYNLPKAWYLVSAPIITADWESGSGDKWVVPIGGGVGKVFKVGKMPINMQLSGYYNVETPTDGPDWQLRFQFQFLFPK